MSDLDVLRYALSAWQLCQVATYMRGKGDNWSAGVLEKVAERFTAQIAKEIGPERLAEAMRRVLDRATADPDPETEQALEDALDLLDAEEGVPDGTTVH